MHISTFCLFSSVKNLNVVEGLLKYQIPRHSSQMCHMRQKTLLLSGLKYAKVLMYGFTPPHKKDGICFMEAFIDNGELKHAQLAGPFLILGGEGVDTRWSNVITLEGDKLYVETFAAEVDFHILVWTL